MSIRVWHTKGGTARYSPVAWSLDTQKHVHLGTFDTRQEAEEVERHYRLKQVEQRRAELEAGKMVSVGPLGHCGAKPGRQSAEIRVVVTLDAETRILLERLIRGTS